MDRDIGAGDGGSADRDIRAGDGGSADRDIGAGDGGSADRDIGDGGGGSAESRAGTEYKRALEGSGIFLPVLYPFLCSWCAFVLFLFLRISKKTRKSGHS